MESQVENTAVDPNVEAGAAAEQGTEQAGAEQGAEAGTEGGEAEGEQEQPKGSRPESEGTHKVLQEAAPIDHLEALGLKGVANIEKVIDAIKAGKLPELARVMSADYRAMSDEDIFRQEIRKANPKASEKAVEALLKKQLDKYDLGFDDQEAGEELRKLDADKVRDVLEAEQAEYKVQAPEATTPNPEQQKLQQEEQEKLKEFQVLIESNPGIKEFEMNPVITVGKGDEAFNYAVDPSLKVRDTLNSNVFYDQFFSKDKAGKPVFDGAKWARVMAYAANPDKFETELANHFKSVGSKAEYVNRPDPETEMAGSLPGAGKPKITARIV